MKRFLLHTAIAAFVILLFSITAFAAESQWLIDSLDKLEKWTTDSSMLQYEIKNGKCEFAVFGDEAYISYSFSKGESIDLSRCKTAAFRASCDVEGVSVKIVAESGDGKKYESISTINGDGEWHDYSVDFTAKGNVTAIRIYFIFEGYADQTAHILLDRVGFFESDEKKQSFLDRTLVSLKEKEEIVYPSGKGPFKWSFSETSDVNEWYFSADHMQEPGMLKLSPIKDENVKIWTTFENNLFNSREYRFFAIRYKSFASYNVARIDFTTSDSIVGSEYFVLKNDGAWHNLVVDMSKYSSRKWNGYIEKAELILPYKNTSLEDYLYIERVGFFDNYSDASQYLVESADREDYKNEKIFKGENYKIIVPAGAMNAPYDEKDVSADFSADIKPTDIVMLNGSPLVLSDVSDDGYVVYCAKQKGMYTIGSYEKKYDDTDGHWAKEYIDYVSARKLFSGTTENTYSPDMTLTRGMFVTVLGRMHGVDTEAVGTDSGYNDVPSDEYYAPYIKWVKENKLFLSDGEKFYPNQPITRAEMAFIIANYTDFCGFKLQSYENSNDFSDISGCSDEYKMAIEKIQSIGIINGKLPNVFDPDGILTRAEAATVMTRLIKSVLGVFHGNENFENGGIRIGAYANFDVDSLSESLLYAYLSAGFDSMLMSNAVAESDKRDFVIGYCDRHGIDTVVPLDYTYGNVNVVSEYSGHPSFVGSLAADEPGATEFNSLADFSKAYSEKYADEKLVVNLLPLYSSEHQLEYGKLASYPDYYDTSPKLYRKYCEDFVNGVNTDVVMTNVFPFIGNDIYKNYIEAIAIPADVAKESSKEFWCIVQVDDAHSNKEYLVRQYYMLLSFGCKNIILWLWNDGLCDDYGAYTDAYNSVKATNYEFKSINKLLSQYTYSYTAVNNAEAYGEFCGLESLPDGVRVEDGKNPVIVGVFENGDKGAFTFFNTSCDEPAEIVVDLSRIGDNYNIFSKMISTEIFNDSESLTISLGCGEGVIITF